MVGSDFGRIDFWSEVFLVGSTFGRISVWSYRLLVISVLVGSTFGRIGFWSDRHLVESDFGRIDFWSDVFWSDRRGRIDAGPSVVDSWKLHSRER